LANFYSNKAQAFRKKMFFFEKKNQKTFAPLRACVTAADAQQKNQRFFASFCSQKEVLTS